MTRNKLYIANNTNYESFRIAYLRLLYYKPHALYI